MSDSLKCERCDGLTDYETAVSTDDGCYLCAACDAHWREVFAACQHTWEPHFDQHGEPSQYCTRCAGLVNDVDFAGMFGERPPGFMEGVC